jgi:cytochrome c oxidase subunit 2
MQLKAFKRAAISATIASSVLLLLSSCSSSSNTSDSSYGFSKNASSVNDTSHSLWAGAWIAAGIVGVFTAILILWPVFRHRRKKGETTFPKQTRYNVPSEIAYTLIPFLIVAVLFYFTAKDESKITKVQPQSVAAHNITVNAIQWSWQFTYSDAAAHPTVTGTPEKIPTLVVPQGESVRYTLTSSDVVHGFWIPAFMIQMQTLPHVTNHLQFTANKIGTYPGRCNILCGRNHSQMLFKVKVVSPADYTTYINSLKAA